MSNNSMSAQHTPHLLHVTAGPHGKRYEVSMNDDGTVNRVTFVHVVFGRRPVQINSRTGKHAINAARAAIAKATGAAT